MRHVEANESEILTWTKTWIELTQLTPSTFLTILRIRSGLIFVWRNKTRMGGRGDEHLAAHLSHSPYDNWTFRAQVTGENCRVIKLDFTLEIEMKNRKKSIFTQPRNHLFTVCELGILCILLYVALWQFQSFPTNVVHLKVNQDFFVPKLRVENKSSQDTVFRTLSWVLLKSPISRQCTQDTNLINESQDSIQRHMQTARWCHYEETECGKKLTIFPTEGRKERGGRAVGQISLKTAKISGAHDFLAI